MLCHRGRSTRGHGLVGGAAHGANQLAVSRGLNSYDGFARIHRALESIRTQHGHDVTDLCDAQYGSHAGHQVLTESGGGPQDMAIGFRHGGHLRRNDCSQWVDIGRVVYLQDAGDTFQGRSLGGDLRSVSGKDGHVNAVIFDTGGAVNALGGTGIERVAVMFGDDKNASHYSNPLSLSALTNPSTSSTMTPFWRWAGGSVFTIFSCGLSATPRSSRERVSRGLRLAFMMSGSFT